MIIWGGDWDEGTRREKGEVERRADTHNTTSWEIIIKKILKNIRQKKKKLPKETGKRLESIEK